MGACGYEFTNDTSFILLTAKVIITQFLLFLTQITTWDYICPSRIGGRGTERRCKFIM